VPLRDSGELASPAVSISLADGESDLARRPDFGAPFLPERLLGVLRGTLCALEEMASTEAAEEVEEGASVDARVSRLRGTIYSHLTVSVATRQSGTEAIFRNPARSGSRSISEAMTAGSILSCSFLEVDEPH
jgi:hypothetical protein